MVRIVSAGSVARRVAAALPAIALATTGIAFATSSTPSTTSTKSTSGLTVPDEALTGGASPLYPSAGPAPAPMQLPPVYSTFTADPARMAVPAVAKQVARAIGALAPVRLDMNGIPAPALAAYNQAADLLRGVDPGCGLDWALLGAIGRVESNHSRFGGNVLDTAGIARPGIIGIPLDGTRGTAHIGDTDNGVWDRDTAYDRAVGPMQFIPGTWRMSGRDGDGDGVANPQSMADAATAAGTYLCSGQGNLTNGGDAYQAVLRYNHSDDYVRSVLSIADAYRRGVAVVPMSAIPAARPASGSGSQTPDGSGFGWGGSEAPPAQPSEEPKPAAKPKAKPSEEPKPSPSEKPAPSEPTDGGSGSEPTSPPKTPSKPSLPEPSVPLPEAPLPKLPAPSVPLPTPTSLTVEELLELTPLPRLLGDPAGLVRVLDPDTRKVVCVLDEEKVVACP